MALKSEINEIENVFREQLLEVVLGGSAKGPEKAKQRPGIRAHIRETGRSEREN